jgi:hypothetical protein
VLFSGNVQYMFRYIARDGTRQSTWSDRPDLPLRIEVNILDGPDPVLPALELPLYADMSAACLLQPEGLGCPRAPKQGQTYEQLHRPPR